MKRKGVFSRVGGDAGRDLVFNTFVGKPLRSNRNDG